MCMGNHIDYLSLKCYLTESWKENEWRNKKKLLASSRCRTWAAHEHAGITSMSSWACIRITHYACLDVTICIHERITGVSKRIAALSFCRKKLHASFNVIKTVENLDLREQIPLTLIVPWLHVHLPACKPELPVFWPGRHFDLDIEHCSSL